MLIIYKSMYQELPTKIQYLSYIKKKCFRFYSQFGNPPQTIILHDYSGTFVPVYCADSCARVRQTLEHPGNR